MNRSIVLLLLLLPLAACAEPASRPGTWQPTGANEANLRAMVADPRDLTNGQAAGSADGAVVTAAVARYRAGKVRELPDSGVAKISPVGTGTSPAAAATDGAP